MKREVAENSQLTPLRKKLYVPPLRPNWISRPRLDRRMDERFERKRTLISAPAGCGKSTLVIDWVHSRKVPAAWFSVDKFEIRNFICRCSIIF
jgi:LuxR family maltose regulon positive regulatory protein